MTTRDFCDQAPAAMAATAQSGHIGVGLGLVDEYQARRIMSASCPVRGRMPGRWPCAKPS
jgi:hypothetical protein